jgi:hypothetical protein
MFRNYSTESLSEQSLKNEVPVATHILIPVWWLGVHAVFVQSEC